MKRICILTATRAEYGLLSTLIKKMKSMPEFDVKVVVTGMHLSTEYGLTWREIEADGVKIDKKIEMLLGTDTPSAISKSMGVALIGFADYFSEIQPDALIVLGDRYETLAVCIAAMNARIPIFHIHGGEVTEGAIDDAIRHSITKMSFLHFTSTEEYRNRVIQLGESPERVFNVGALGVENALNTELMSKTELEKSINWGLGDMYAVLTYHPVTLEDEANERSIDELLEAISEYPNIHFLITKSNADAGGRLINAKLENYVRYHDNARLYDSLGMRRYLSAVKFARFVIGNSSSGLLEAPVLGTYTVNVGNRQKGRIHGKSVLDCSAERNEIVKAINLVLGMDDNVVDNPYGDGNTSERIIDIIRKTKIQAGDLKKEFYNLWIDN